MNYKIAIKVKTAPSGTYPFLYPFDKDSVKVGNIKDPQKIEEKVSQAAQAYKDEADSKACLSSVTGKICAIGVAVTAIDAEKGTLVETQPKAFFTHSDESKLLEDFWSAMVTIQKDYLKPGDTCKIVVWSDFDIPFILQRSIITGQSSQGCTLFPSMGTHNTFKQNGIAEVVNLMKVWNCNTYNTEKLWNVAAALDFISPTSKEFEDYRNSDQAAFYRLFDTPEGETKALKQIQMELDFITNIANLIL